MIFINGNTSGNPGNDIPRLIRDNGESFNGDLSIPGRVTFRLPDGIPPHGATVIWNGTKSDRIITAIIDEVPLPPGSYEGSFLIDPLVTLNYSTGSFPIIVEGRYFKRADTNERLTVGINSDFQLLDRLLRGEDIDSIMDSRGKSGGSRVFGTCNNLFQLDPRTYGEAYWTALSILHQKHIDKGKILKLCVFTDQQYPLFNGFDRQGFWREMCIRTQGWHNFLLTLVNEWFKNGIVPTQFSPIPNGVPQSPGSFIDGYGPPNPSWTSQPNTFNDFNPTRTFKWPATVGITVWELHNYPGGNGLVFIDEPMGAAEADEFQRRSTDAESFGHMAVDCGEWSSGGCFHSQAGLNSLPWGPIQANCAHSFFTGLEKIGKIRV